MTDLKLLATEAHELETILLYLTCLDYSSVRLYLAYLVSYNNHKSLVEHNVYKLEELIVNMYFVLKPDSYKINFKCDMNLILLIASQICPKLYFKFIRDNEFDWKVVLVDYNEIPRLRRVKNYKKLIYLIMRRYDVGVDEILNFLVCSK